MKKFMIQGTTATVMEWNIE